jgi:hypothetical protein
MNGTRLGPLLAWLALGSASAAAADLSKIDRRIAREPAYQSGAPTYCLLVFGPEARFRAWLVLDGDTLYVDRNGNGDLTEEGERVAVAGRTAGTVQFNAGDLVEPGGGTRYRDLKVWRRQKRGGFSVSLCLDPDGKHPEFAGGYSHKPSEGDLVFADSPGDAPVIHFGGRPGLKLYPPTEFRRDVETRLVIGFGTPGLGRGTLAVSELPTTAAPIVEVTFPPRRPGDKAPVARVALSGDD